MMKLRVLFPSLLLLCVFAHVPAQAQSTLPTLEHETTAASVASSSSDFTQPALALHPVSLDETAGRIAEATGLLKTRSAGTPRTKEIFKFVTLAALDNETGAIHLLPLSKELFLTRNAEINALTSLGHLARVEILRANGVNTAVTILDTETGRQLVPLVVEYPIEKSGELREMAYYTSVHPALLSPRTIAGGETYIRTMLDRAAAQLRAGGVEISPGIVDVAEHLCVVEHTDHKRFLNEDRTSLFDEIYSLYALNEPRTFRYSVSTAGAGGMVQMIPQTYQMVRERHPNVPLNPDFVSGMTDHNSALSAMLLYMQDTWTDLLRNQEVQDALTNGIATQPELVAAGYNSNPARLPQYLRRGGALWRTLIPTETQMYLQIYNSLDGLVAFQPRTAKQPSDLAANGNNNTGNTLLGTTLNHLRRAATSTLAGSLSQLLPALSNQLWLNGPLLTHGLR
jgi:hypothetical protein